MCCSGLPQEIQYKESAGPTKSLSLARVLPLIFLFSFDRVCRCARTTRHVFFPKTNFSRASKANPSRPTTSLSVFLFCGGGCGYTLRHIATYCDTLQHTATHCNTPQVAKQSILSKMLVHIKTAATHCNTLQPQLQHNATHCATLRHTATNYSTLQHTATHRRWPRRVFFRR